MCLDLCWHAKCLLICFLCKQFELVTLLYKFYEHAKRGIFYGKIEGISLYSFQNNLNNLLNISLRHLHRFSSEFFFNLFFNKMFLIFFYTKNFQDKISVKFFLFKCLKMKISEKFLKFSIKSYRFSSVLWELNYFFFKIIC